MNTVLLSLATLLILALSAAFAAPYFVDWNAYKSVFESQATRLVGREVRIDGDVRLRLLPAPEVRFEDVRIANASGSFDRPFAHARIFTAWVSVPPLLSGVVEARRIAVEQPVLDLRIAADGSVNWAGLGPSGAALPFMPAAVTLEQVEFRNGRVTTQIGDAEPTVIEPVTAILSAQSLDGPYRLTASFPLAGSERELKVSTARRDTGGDLRLRAMLTSAAGTDSYVFEGTAAGLASVPAFKGRLMARFADPGSRLPDEAKPGPEGDQTAAIEVKAEVTAGPTRAVLDQVEIALRHDSRPQTLTGQVRADWAGQPAVQGQFTARWLDLDALAGAGEGARAPARVAAALADRLLAHVGGIGDVRASLTVEQAVLGGDVVHQLRLDGASDGEAILITRLAMRLPGDNEMTLAGTLRQVAGEPSFFGRAELAGKRLSRLLRWAGAGDARLGAADAGDYALEAQIAAAPDRLEFDKVQGNALGSAFSGALRYNGGGNPRFDLAFDSDRLDLRRLLGEEASLNLLAGLFASDSDPSAEPGWVDRVRASVDLRVGAVTLPRLGEATLAAKLTLAAGSLDVATLNLAAGSGLAVRGEGRLTGIASGRPDGRITLAIDASEPASLAALSDFLALPETVASHLKVAALSPMKVLLAVQSRREEEGTLELRAGGSLGSSNLALTLALKGDVARIGHGRIDLVGSLSNDDGKVLLAQALPWLAAADVARLGAGKGVLTVSARGVPATALDSRVMLEAAGLRLSLDGESVISGAAVDFSGRTALRAPDAAAALSLAGLEAGNTWPAAPIELDARLDRKATIVRLHELQGHVGNQSLHGHVRVDTGGPRPRLDAELVTGAVVLPHLFSPLLGWQEPPASIEAVLGTAGATGYWPDQRFDSALLEAVDGTVRLSAERLHLAGALVLAKATLAAKLSGGTLDIETLQGDLFGGSLTASARLAKHGPGVAFKGQADAKGVDLTRLTALANGQPLAAGVADVVLSVAGEGLSPAGIVAGLTGEGRLAVARGTIRNLAPAGLRGLAERPHQGRGLQQRVSAQLEQGHFPLDGVTAPFTVRNGTLRFDKVTLRSEAGAAVVSAYVDLPSLRLDSEWVLAPEPPAPDRAGPEVALVFNGSLFDFGQIAPSLDTTALERYITMRHMERDVRRLEELDVRNPSSAPPPLPAEPQASPPQPPDLPPQSQASQPGAAAAAAIPPGSVLLVAPPPLPDQAPQRAGPPAAAPGTAAPDAGPDAAPPATQPRLPWLTQDAPPPAAVPDGLPSAVAPPRTRRAPPSSSVPPQWQRDVWGQQLN